MRTVTLAALAALAATAPPAVAAEGVSVQATSNGALTYDAATATLKGTMLASTALLLDSTGVGVDFATQGAIASLTIGFDAPLARTVNFEEINFTATGYRYVSTFVSGTATSFEYRVDSLPDAGGNTINLLTVKSTPGFSTPFVDFAEGNYYFYPDGTERDSGHHLYNPYLFSRNLGFIGLYPPCNCAETTFPAKRLTEFTATSDLPGYVQNVWPQSNAFSLWHLDSPFDLRAVRASSTGLADSFSGSAYMTWMPAVPEPASWAMMIAGFGLVGGAMRRRRAVA